LTSIACENFGEARWLSELRNISERKSIEIAQARSNARLAEQAAMDSLTGVFNRRHIMLALEKEAARARRNGHPLCVLLIDVDHFKPFNEHYGHTQGDVCLRDIARQISASLQRPADTVGRHGGKEFLVLLPETDARGMRQVAEKIRRNVVDMRIAHAVSPSRIVTVSVGGVYLRASTVQSADVYVEMATTALAEAKRRGRDCVICNVENNTPSTSEDVSLPAD
jgi:diguanylate cyclase (GGDEF)-like protein